MLTVVVNIIVVDVVVIDRSSMKNPRFSILVLKVLGTYAK